MNNLYVAAVAVFAAARVFALAPSVSDVRISQGTDRIVKVSYTLSGAPAIVTVELATNGVSIADMVKTVSGDGNRLVSSNGRHEMSWRARADWPDSTTRLAHSLSATVKAWHPSNPPAILCLNLQEGSGGACWYESTNALPGGIGSDAYRTVKLLLRRAPVKYRTYEVGIPLTVLGRSVSESTDPYSVTFTNDFWMAVFETTYAQWKEVMGWAHKGSFSSTVNDNWKVRPVLAASITEIRESSTYPDSVNTDTSYWYPHSPHPDSFLGKLYARTGMRCELPSRSQWSVAALAGQRYGVDGFPITNATHTAAAEAVGRCKYNGGNYLIDGAYVAPGDSEAPDFEYGSARVGSYKPNPWGFYDMFGNAQEITLDYHQTRRLGNIHDPYGEPYCPLDYDRTASGTGMVVLGESWNGTAGSGILQAGHGGFLANNKHNGFRIMFRVNQASFYTDLQ